jgi:hypothetical protein
MLMGNRGSIHRADRTLGVTRWRSKMWICCVLTWGDVRRDVMPPGRWTALFFLDEVTALAAGHRPCGYCRRQDHLAFAHAWQRAQRMAERPRAGFMDIALHAERVESHSRRKRAWQATVADLPDGSMIMHDSGPALLTDGSLLPWTITGYGTARPVGQRQTVTVLTPRMVAAALGQGYLPMVHPSAGPTSLRAIGQQVA